VEVLLGKYLWLLDVCVTALCASLLGLAASELLRARLVAAPSTPALPRRSHTPSFAVSRTKRPDAILRRNVFCSTCPPILLDGDPAPAPPRDERPPDAQPTSLPLKLVATMYAPDEVRQRWSTAVIRDSERGSVGAFVVGASVHGAEVLSILASRVYLDNGGSIEFLDLFASPRQPPPPMLHPSVPAPSDPFLSELDRGIKKVGDHRYELQRSTLESVMGNLSLLSRSARILPDVRAGKPYGFRLFAVRPEGPFAKIGLQNGDVIVSINGLEMTSPEKALEVYAKLKSASHLALGLERNGQKVAQEYVVR
jgi:general secretion pathway protein C